MVIHLVPCGTSILGVSGKPFVDDLLRERAAATAIAADEREAQVLAGLGFPAIDLEEDHAPQVRDWLTRIWNDTAQPTNVDKGWSAELTSLLSDNTVGTSQLDRGDTVVLMASDTREGVAAAILVAVALFRSDPAHGAPRYLPKPGNPARLPGVVVVRQPNLNAMQPATFEQGLLSVAKTMIEVDNVAGAARYQAHLSGGFKAAIPFLGLLISAFACSHHVTARTTFGDAAGASVIDVPVLRLGEGILTGKVHPGNGPVYNAFGTAMTPAGRALERLYNPPPRP
jgi:hypothetical protein